MKLAVIGPVYPYRGGIAHYTTRLGQVLQENGHDVLMVSFSRQYPAFLYPGRTDKDPSQDHPEVDAQFVLDPLYPWTWFKAARLIQKWQPEMVLIQWWTTFWGPALFVLAALLRERGLGVAFNIHNVVPHERRFFDRRVAKWTLSRGQACIPLSQREEQRLRDLLPGMRIFSANLPVHQVVAARLPKAEARRRLNLPPAAPLLLMFGIIRHYKGLNILLDALGELKKDGLTPLLQVAGEFWQDEQGYRAQIERLGLQAQVFLENRFIPNEELGVFFSAADFYAAPYVGGTQSGAIRIALEFGLPVLASDLIAADLPVASAQIWIHPAGDAAALAKDLRAALQSESAALPGTQVVSGGGWDELLATLRQVRDTLGRAK